MIMRGIDIIAAFELEINKLDDALTKPDTDDSLYWVNQAVVKFVKDRFNGNAPKRTSYEQNEKRTRDLVRLLRQYEPATPEVHTEYHDYNYYEYTYPEDMMFALNEDVTISDMNDGNLVDTCVFECTADSFMYRINNSLTDFHYRHHRARPLRIRSASKFAQQVIVDDAQWQFGELLPASFQESDKKTVFTTGFKLLTDKKYKIKKYILGYLKKPEELTNANPNTEYKDFEDYTWLEIVKIAAQMYVENQSDPRYRTITNEVLTQE